MTERTLLLLGVGALLVSAIAFGFTGRYLLAGLITLAALLVFWFMPKHGTAIRKSDGPVPSPSEVKAYRQEHPGTSVSEAVSEPQRGK
ncbi:hypothetical protein [Corynebacterium heidelbergense]|uniref:Uncharacterized protein n=1 Tax=Corynebacterium heidelbergense TaxID=2055947 RepID=A0A364VBY7_9CORY|nr:hypothetical protein [Corynebacterium heidelbergense]RAV34131.1 hypothetical protein CWC39_04775 [Corynebacterium heidelbergense]WCZ36106.1 hypothetical protein CHEID_02715 [Corynebacterium heidelbergense]